MDLLKALTHLDIPDIIDIAVVAVVIYALVLGIRKSRSGVVLTGFIMVSSLYVVARLLGLNLVTFIFQTFFTVILVALIVIFQEDLRRLFERVALRSLRRRRGAENASSTMNELVEILVRTLDDLARDRVGVILVVEGRDTVLRHVHGGVSLDAQPSEALFKSLFDPHSIGHDGAVIVSGERVMQFSCHLPLSANDDQLRGRGTRHAAALGLAERCDALCLVVSEERGTISVAQNGHLVRLEDSLDLARVVEEFLLNTRPPRSKKRWVDVVRHHPMEKAAALIVAVLLWFFLVHESEVVYRGFTPSMHHAGLRPGLAVESVQPESVQVILSGPRRSFYFIEDSSVALTTKLFGARAGTQRVNLTAPDFSFPQGLTFVNILPRELSITIATAPRGPEEDKQPPK